MINNKFLRWFLGILAVLLIISAIFQILTPKEQPVPSTNFVSSGINNTTSDFSNIAFTGVEPGFIDKLSIHQVSPMEKEDQIIQQIIAQYNFKPDSQIENYWTNNQNQYLSQSKYTQKYQMGLGEPSATLNVVTDLDESISIAQKQLKELFPTLNLSPLKNRIEVIKASHEFYQPTSFDQADLLILPFAYTINDYPLRYEKEIIDPFMVLMNNKGQVLRVDFSPLFISTQPLSTSSRITINDAINNINNDQGSIISFGLKDTHKTDISVIKSADFEEVTIEYRYDSQIGLAYPFYRFSGTGKDLGGLEITLEVNTPAVKTVPVEQ